MKLNFIRLAFLMGLIAGFQASAHEASEFRSVAHPITGALHVRNTASGVVIEISDDFMTAHGPDLRLVLEKRAVPGRLDPQQDKVLAPLQSESGAQIYQTGLSANELAAYRSLSIYCYRYDVVFGYAEVVLPPMEEIR